LKPSVADLRYELMKADLPKLVKARPVEILSNLSGKVSKAEIMAMLVAIAALNEPDEVLTDEFNKFIMLLKLRHNDTMSSILNHYTEIAQSRIEHESQKANELVSRFKKSDKKNVAPSDLGISLRPPPQIRDDIITMFDRVKQGLYEIEPHKKVLAYITDVYALRLVEKGILVKRYVWDDPEHADLIRASIAGLK